MGLNIGLVASTVFSVWSSHSVPVMLAVSCGAVGGVTIYSRVRTWRTGEAKRFYDLIQDNEEATKKMRTIDAMFWATGAFNSVVCLWSVFQ